MGHDAPATAELQNDHNVYVLGAGFSFDAGLPLVSNFMEVMRDSTSWLEETGQKEELDSIWEVLRFRAQASQAGYHVNLDLDNVEHLFSLAAAMPDDPLRHALPRAIAATLEYASRRGNAGRVELLRAAKELAVHPDWTKTLRTVDHFTLAVPYYDFVVGALVGHFAARRGPRTKNTFVTFNYDTIVEDALERLDEPSRGAGQSYVDSTLVLKLHGSVSWGLVDDKVIEVRSYQELRAQGAVPVLVPPTWSKDLGDVGYPWREAVKAISTATRLVFIGYSFAMADSHVTYMLAAGLGQNISLRKIVVVDPNSPSISKRLQSVFRNRSRIRYPQPDASRAGCTLFDFIVHEAGSIGRGIDGPDWAYSPGPIQR